MFDIDKILAGESRNARYEKRLNKLIARGVNTTSIEHTVAGVIENLKRNSRSFVVYGEPQSGKTEMMIALTAKLLDEGHRVIIVLLNDNVQLLLQNLERFQRSGLSPSPKNFVDVLDPSINITGSELVIFCKKNASDLTKLIKRIGPLQEKVIIDDEADFASPNARVNSGDQTKINKLIEALLGEKGIYIGVTATPGRLDLNNTFANQNNRWVDFLPHPGYVGQETFFPTAYKKDLHQLPFQLHLIPNQGESSKYLQQALFSFFVNVAHLNIQQGKDENFSMLIHTSGKTIDHTGDYQQIMNIFSILTNEQHSNNRKYFQKIWEIATKRYPGQEDEIIRYIWRNISLHTVIVMNSERDKTVANYNSATNPTTLFTIAIGGNIISRGVTFDNLLSMFFTRDVKRKMHQDTYIQRARMFGSRKSYLPYFDLFIPEDLYTDWHRCFIFHRLSLTAIKSGKGVPVWIEDQRIASTAASSVDRTTVSMYRGEMTFGKFQYNKEVDAILTDESLSQFAKLVKIAAVIGDDNLPSYLLNFIKEFSPEGDSSILIHKTRSVRQTSQYHDSLTRRKKLMSGVDMAHVDHIAHHIRINRNTVNKARIVYRYVGNLKMMINS